MAPLGDGARAALRATLGRKHGRHQLKDDVIDALVDYWGGRGEELRSIPWDVDVEDEGMWRTEWRALLEDAGIESELEQLRVINWLVVRGRPASKSSDVSSGVARQALKILDEHGVVVSAEVERELTKMVALGDAGDELS